ncbi:D-aspartate oxidase-like [Littorina saxatilis]|uniref:FAD dependent oxidoreductase domain-containing protein n=1 Tax=Littorina saxatilis TaxID=31220 RepID=A0AAN9C170_9CAEN
MVRVAIIGAGIVGLTSAVNVQKSIPGAKVTIIADKFDKDTTSAGAGGLYRPTAALVKGVPPETVREWVQDTWDYYTSLAMSPEAGETGQTLVPGYMLSDNQSAVQNQLFESIVFNFKLLTPDDLKRLKLPFKYGCSFVTVITQPQKFMPWLMRKFKEQGGTVEFRTVGKLDELAGAYDIVINCSALGSRQLVQDHSMYAVKGQLVHVKAPWVKTFLYCDDKKTPTYFIPHDDCIIVGGTREEGNYSIDIVPEVQEDILRRAGEILPQIKGGRVVGSWAGIRPSRDPLRLEKELLTIGGKKLRVVHNYGHGANGVTLSWGTSLRAARMAKEWAQEITPSARL